MFEEKWEIDYSKFKTLLFCQVTGSLVYPEEIILNQLQAFAIC